MNRLELLQSEIQELQLEKDVLFETVILEKEVHNLKSDLRGLSGLYDIESFQADIKNVLKAVATSFVVIGGLLLDGLDKFLNWCDNINKGGKNDR